MPYRRSIYIGLGGLGIQTISKVKECYDRVMNLVEPIIKFVGIDTDVQNLRASGLNRDECIASRSNDAMACLHAHPNEYTWLPDENRHYLQSLTNHGAGQIRSNGRFTFENNKDEIRRHLLRCYQEITQADPGIADIMFVPNIDIHIVSSIAGGTGSGIIIELAKQIREIIPNSNIMGYFFSHSFFRAIGVHWNITPNAYATLFELNCEMSSQNKPFDVCLYVDNRTDDHNNTLMPYVVDIDYAINAVANTMYIVSSFGNGFSEYYDDIKAAMASGAFDKGIRKSWLAGIGSCALSYNEDEIYNYIYHEVASKFVWSLLNGNETSCDVNNNLYDRINESFHELDTDLSRVASPLMIDIEEDGSIHEDRMLTMLNDYNQAFRRDIISWTENTRAFLSTNVDNMLKSHSTSLSSIERIVSGLLGIIDKLIDENEYEQQRLFDEKSHTINMLEHDVQQLRWMVNNFFFRIVHRTEIEQLKEEIRSKKSRILIIETTLFCKDNAKGSLLRIHNFCIELAEQISLLIQSVKSIKDEIDDFINNSMTNRLIYNGGDIDITTDIMRQLDDSILDSISANGIIVREELFRDQLHSNITKENIISHISHNCADINIDFNNLLANSESLNHYLIDICRRSNVLLNLDFKGENILQSESIVVATPYVLAPHVMNVVANQLGKIKIPIQIINEDNNEIRIYRISYLYPPHYIEKAFVFDSNRFKLLLERSMYSPFTDKKYISEYAKNGSF